MVLRSVGRLADQLEERVGQVVNVTQWISYFSFDTMGELAFNKSFGMLDKHEWTGSVKLLREGMNILGVVTPAPWLAQVVFAFLPKSLLLWHALINFAKDMMGDRLNVYLPIHLHQTRLILVV